MGKALYNPNDRLTGRDGGPYLDEEQALADEIRRAKVEGREPDLENPPANAGIPLSTAAQLLRAIDVNQPSAFHQTEDSAELMFTSAAESDNLLKVRDEIPDEVYETPEEGEDVDKDEDVVYNPNDPNAPVHGGEAGTPLHEQKDPSVAAVDKVHKAEKVPASEKAADVDSETTKPTTSTTTAKKTTAKKTTASKSFSSKSK